MKTEKEYVTTLFVRFKIIYVYMCVEGFLGRFVVMYICSKKVNLLKSLVNAPCLSLQLKELFVFTLF